MFFPGDIYSGSGSLKLYGCWTDKVTKYDSSSFYNWEQDNLPIYDLEERTFFLWEQLGYPTSSMPGVALVVSADAPDSAITCNKGVFRSLSAAIETLPQKINFPVLVEVASFGQLGDLVLSNLRFGPKGSLEIINRNFAKQEASVSSPTNTYGINPPVVGVVDSSVDNVFSYVSSVIRNPNSAFYDASTSRIAPLKGFLEASCLSISAPVFSSTTDSRLSGTGSYSKLNAYISLQKSLDNYGRSTLVIDDFNTVNPYTVGDQYALKFKPYDLNPYSTEQITTKDASTLNYFSGVNIYLGNGWQGGATLSGYNGLYYGNKLNKLFVNNCDGKIFIRNFFLEGGGSTKTNNLHGVEVNNCQDVVLENIVSTRYRKAGFKFNNSNVVITRGCVATRIYDFDSSGNRLTANYDVRRKFLSFNVASGYPQDDSAAGIVANNSTITFSSTHQFENQLYSSAWNSASATPFTANYYVFEFTKNANGMILNNSIVQGGKIQENLKVFPSLYESYFDFAHNVGHGIISNNSKVSLDGRLRLLENLIGAEINNSILELDKLTCAANQKQGINSINSKIIYNKNYNIFHAGGSLAALDLYNHAYYFKQNGQHLTLNNSIMSPVLTSSMENTFGRIVFENSIGKLVGDPVTYLGVAIPEAVKIQNNSEATFVSPEFIREDNFTIQIADDTRYSKKGSELCVTDNSKATLRGTKYFATKSFGPSTGDYSRNLAGLYADKNSSIHLNGPTVIAQFGVDLLAENNSKILISPPRQTSDNSLDLFTIDLTDPANHTAVELHSTRACVVVDNHSTFEARDLGDTYSTWGSDPLASSIVNSSGIDYGDISVSQRVFTSGGSLQFYPNPLESLLVVNQIAESFGAGVVNTEKFTPVGVNYYFLHNLALTGLSMSAATFGGVCVKAVNNSNVNIHNVNFPCGWWNASAPYFDSTVTLSTSGAQYHSFIWNICDDSLLKASYLSVSGLYPRNSGYKGPYGVWLSGTGASSVAFGVPSSTPDTSTVSILDLYGANLSAATIPYASTSATNYGPFRLYFSVDPAANALINLDGSGYGIMSQIYSQGYQPSSNLMICSGSLSSIYKSLIKQNSNGNYVASGYYYGNDIILNDSVRAILDESAAETFANAKHCSVGKSNNAKLVTIYYPYNYENTNSVKYGDSAKLLGLGSLNLFDMERDN
jgi:hypothetical protein